MKVIVQAEVFQNVREERILERGLKPPSSAQSVSSEIPNPSQRRTNPRKGIETHQLGEVLAHEAAGQRRTNPRKGIETNQRAYAGLPQVEDVREERILERGLKLWLKGR